ncbi:MAG: N,N'-diacetylchitobiose phosphorylase, partial [Lachnospiraceae bacterium]|nr:N,N'-diacetylchitobiose phosphorylase [Lachnospiraceae bacterium]
MRFGYFDEANKEYVIDRPDTPAPWANYLGSPEYGAIISNNAGGYSFVKSGANGRIIRYVFNNFDQPGRYIYIRDNKTRDYWSASWQPVGKPLDVYKSECHHGTGYTNIKASYEGIDSEALYYVPLDKTHEVWKVKVTNNSNEEKDLSVFGYCEFTNDNNYEQDQVNLQYTLFITKTYFVNNRIKQVINENVTKSAVNDSKVVNRVFGLVGADVASYCGDKEEFLGRYHSYANPVGVENGNCGNKLNYNINACGALETKLILKPGESKEFAFILGMKSDSEADEIMAAYNDVAKKSVEEIAELKEYWHSKLNHL